MLARMGPYRSIVDVVDSISKYAAVAVHTSHISG